MLRAFVLLLLIANAGFWVWRQGWLEPLHGVIGARPEGEREPERLAHQVTPERVELLSAEAARPVSAPPAASATTAPVAETAAACLEIGPYSAADLAPVEVAVKAALPANGWSVRELPPGWWVAMGPYADADTLQKKKDELRRRGLSYEQAASAPGAAPVLVLSRHESRAAAQQELNALNDRGSVRTARVLGATAGLRMLRVAQADAAQQATLSALPAATLRGKTFAPCPPGSGL